MKGVHAGVLFINGNEVSTAQADRLLVIPGNGSAADTDQHSTQQVVTQAKALNATVFVAYPEEFKSWDSTDYDGVEVYNVYTNAREINPVAHVLRRHFGPTAVIPISCLPLFTNDRLRVCDAGTVQLRSEDKSWLRSPETTLTQTSAWHSKILRETRCWA